MLAFPKEPEGNSYQRADQLFQIIWTLIEEINLLEGRLQQLEAQK